MNVTSQQSIEDEVACLPKGFFDMARSEIFKKIVRDEKKNGYSKTFGLSVKVPCSLMERCELLEEWAKRFKSKEKFESLEKQVKVAVYQIRYLTNLVEGILKHKYDPKVF